MKRLFSLCLILIACSCSRGYDIYLCIGQSNMAGRGPLIQEDSVALTGIYLLDYDGEPTPAIAPLNRYSSIRKKLSMQGMNPAWSFARHLYSVTGRRILLVVNAKGGTSICLWTKDAPLDSLSKPFYQEAIRRTKEAMKFGQIKGILWHQGEADSHTPEDRNQYLKRLQSMVQDLREDLGRDIPFVAGEVASNGKCNAINPVLDSIPLVIPHSAIVSAEGLSTLPDNVHFDRESQIAFGIRYAEAMLSLQGKN